MVSTTTTEAPTTTTSTTVPPTTTTTIRHPQYAKTATPIKQTPPVSSDLSSPGKLLGTFLATCYSGEEGYGGTTAGGHKAHVGSVATDPRVIPMGTSLQIEGYGKGVADDVGGAIKGNRIDVWYPTLAQCRAWGSHNVQVWLA